MSDLIEVVSDVANAVCPHCRYRHSMPYECLRVNWQPMTCEHCGTLFEYLGVNVPKPWDVEIHTRLAHKEPTR